MTTNLESVLEELHEIKQHMAITGPNWRLAKEKVDALAARLARDKDDYQELYGEATDS